ncbi:MAG: IS1380 family transposase [Pyrinomonadaceae bacterium]
MEFEIKYTNKEVSPWGGMVLLRQMMDKMEYRNVIMGNRDLPQPGSNRGYEPVTIIEGFMASVWCGANRFLHTEVTRHDGTLGKIFGWKRVPGQDVYKRYFKKFTIGANARVSDYFYRWIFSNIKFDNFTLDCDSSVITRYGEQEGAHKGYNPQKPGRNSHHPLIAFVADIKMVANMWLRSGDTSSSNNFLSFLEDTLAKLEGKTVGLIRLDSGFCSEEIFEHLEEKEIDYIVAARFYQPIQRIIAATQTWMTIDDGIEIAEAMYQSPSWKKPRRMVVVRQFLKERPKAAGKILRLFKDEQFYSRYRYTAYFTSLKLPPAEIWRLYRGRADAENRIKELKGISKNSMPKKI